jgi:Ni,Fe-hydrogenase III small subunit/NAD-dependent dihydropyrimidine dehydrogenase PreA subunit
MIRELKILRQHGRQYVPDISAAELSPLFRGRPVIRIIPDQNERESLAALCPVRAIINQPFGIDLGKCVFCKECHFRAPDKIIFTNDYKIATNDRSRLIVYAGEDKPVTVDPDMVRKEIRSFFKHSLKLRQISAAGDNSCEMELNASGNVNFDMGRYGIEFVASPRHADGIVITGPLSENMAIATRICYNATPDPKLIILVGTDAISGGIFNGSQALERSFIDEIHIDLFVPGNPAHPLTFINGILSLIGKLKN